MKRLKDIEIVFDTEYYNERKKQLGFFDKDVEVLTGLSKDLLSKYKCHYSIPKSANLYKIAMALEVTMEDLLKEIHHE